MKKTTKPKKLTLVRSTLRVLNTADLQDVVGGTSAICTMLTCVAGGCGGSNNSCDACHEN